MPRAGAIGLPEPALQISASPRDTNHISVMRASGSSRRPIATLIFGSKHSTPLGWIRCPHSPVPFPPTTMASDGHSLSNSRRISAGSMAWRSPRRSCGCRYWKRCLSTRRAGYPSDNFFHLLAATPYSVRLRRYCDQAAPLGKVASVDSLGTATITASA